MGKYLKEGPLHYPFGCFETWNWDGPPGVFSSPISHSFRKYFTQPEPKNRTLVSEAFGDRLDELIAKRCERSQRAIAKGVDLDGEMLSQRCRRVQAVTEIA